MKRILIASLLSLPLLVQAKPWSEETARATAASAAVKTAEAHSASTCEALNTVRAPNPVGARSKVSLSIASSSRAAR